MNCILSNKKSLIIKVNVFCTSKSGCFKRLLAETIDDDYLIMSICS